MPSIFKPKEKFAGSYAARLRRLLREMEIWRFCMAWCEGFGPKDPACIVIR